MDFDVLASLGFGDESFSNILVRPSIYARISGRGPYVRGSMVFPTWLNNSEISNHALFGSNGLGAYAGYRLSSGSGIELGYLSIPVYEVEDTTGVTVKTLDFGGVVLRYRHRF